MSNLLMDVIYLPAENNKETYFDAPLQPFEVNNLHSILDSAISNLDFNLDNKTYICLSGISFDYQAIKLIAEYFQQYFLESVIIFGGYHASSSPNDFSYDKSPIDYVVTGEGEISLYNLIKNDVRKQTQPIIIEGIPINDLNDLPPIDLTLLDKYIPIIKKKARGLSISLSRGCPHKCSYCIEKNLAKGKNVKRWRPHTPKRAIEEINTLVNYGLNQDIKIYGFLDPCFGYHKKWLNEFLDLYEPDDQITYHFVETRIDILNEQLISKLQKKKMFQFYGVESFSTKLLEIMNKTHNPKEFLNKIENVLRIHKDLEYKCTLGLITNHPGETRETIQTSFSILSDIAMEDNNDLFHFEPIFYHLFANTANYENLDYLNKKYGTKAYFPEWWKDMKTLKYGAFAVRPSSEITLRDSINLFVKNHLKIERIKSKKNQKDGLGIFMAKMGMLKKQQKELLKFLDENNIEMEEQILTSV